MCSSSRASQLALVGQPMVQQVVGCVCAPCCSSAVEVVVVLVVLLEAVVDRQLARLHDFSRAVRSCCCCGGCCSSVDLEPIVEGMDVGVIEGGGGRQWAEYGGGRRATARGRNE